jgi:ABC-type antimicrobial peptide transport system permease subunit
MHDWTMTSSGASYSASLVVNEEGNLIKIDEVVVKLPAESLKSKEKAMDKNAYKSLNTDKYKEITFSLTSSKVVQNKITCSGNLTIAGTTKPIEAPFVDPSAFRSRLLVVVAAVALLLAVVGIAGVVSHGAARRQREMGIRAALGAPPGTIVRLVIRAGLWPVGVGALLGLFGALTVGRFLRTFVFEVSAYDPAVMTASALALLATGLLASWWPARRTAKIDPASVLRA